MTLYVHGIRVSHLVYIYFLSQFMRRSHISFSNVSPDSGTVLIAAVAAEMPSLWPYQSIFLTGKLTSSQ